MRQLIKRVRQGLHDRLKFGVSVTGLGGGVNRFINGCWKVHFVIGQVVSTGSGHWPATLFEVSWVSGERSCWHITIACVVVGTMWVHALDDAGVTIGPNKKKLYSMFSFFNHHQKQLPEIIN